MWIKVDKLIPYFSYVDFEKWDIEVHGNTARYRFKKKSETAWYYHDTKEMILMLIETDETNK